MSCGGGGGGGGGGGPSIPGPRLEAAILRPDLAGISSIIFSFSTPSSALLMFLLLLDMRTAGIDQPGRWWWCSLLCSVQFINIFLSSQSVLPHDRPVPSKSTELSRKAIWRLAGHYF